MQLRIFKYFSKRINSTKQPNADVESVVLDVTLKKNTSIEAPTFLLAGIPEDINDYNYCLFNDHYYYIDDIIFNSNDVYEIRCRQDLLATYANYIGDTYAFVEYASSEYNKWIADQRLSTTDSITTSEEKVDIFGENTTGCTVVTIAGNNPNNQNGFTTSYRVSSSNLAELSDWLYSAGPELEILKSIFGDPFNAIIEAHWVPGSPYFTGTTIKVGDQSTGISASAIHPTSGYNRIAFEIPWQFNDWRDLQPYTLMQLYIPCYGSITLDQSKFINQTYLYVNENLDEISGEWTYVIESGAYKQIIKFDTSVPLAIGQTRGNKVTSTATTLGGAITWAGAAAGLATGALGFGAALATGIGGISAMAAGAMSYFKEDTSTKGGNGSFSSSYALLGLPFNNKLRCLTLSSTSHSLSTNPISINSICGRPLFAYRKISDLGGYIKCAGASIDIPGLGNDKEEINMYLNGGFYYE